MTYRAPLAGLLMGAAVTYLRICVLGGACNELILVIFIHALNNVMDMLGTQPFVLCSSPLSEVSEVIILLYGGTCLL